MTLRLRLLIALVTLVAVGLLVADAVTYLSLRSFLVTRVDQQLAVAKAPVVQALIDQGANLSPSAPGGPPGGEPSFPPGTYGEVVDSSGQMVKEVVFRYGGSSPPAPSLPVDVSSRVGGGSGQVFLTTGASGSSSLHYRVLAATLPPTDYVLVVAIPLSDVYQTLGRLLAVEGVVTAAVLVVLGLLAWWIVRREMRPLEDMAVTAGAIADGDLSRRVEPAESRTEVGRLGLALNAMLAQIEIAFARRRASEDALRRFLAQASHELRTPLASIRGYAELFRRGAKDRPEDLELAMRRIEEEGARMGVLVEELLLLARLDEGRPLEREPLDLAQVAADAVADARIVAPERAIDLDAPAPVILEGDEMRVRQVATNLVMNALQHAGEDARVRVSARAHGDWAELEVADDGAGMTPEVAERAFEPFYRAGGDGNGDDAGNAGTTGLGLAIAQGIAHAHAGRIDLLTSPGEGARFVVRLPRSTVGEAPAPEVSAPGDPAPGA